MRERTRVTIRGFVQGVFFRDTVRQIAEHYKVDGFVRNAGHDAVEIEAEGESDIIRRFIDDVLTNPPRHARIDDVRTTSIPIAGTRGFSIAPSAR
jgi:acylphosphatase